MAERTPGDWRWGTTGLANERRVDAPDPDDPSCRKEIALVHGDTPEEAEANARLIAAAPAMFAELKRLEWSRYDGQSYPFVCPSCSRSKPSHAINCPLAAALAAVESPPV